MGRVNPIELGVVVAVVVVLNLTGIIGNPPNCIGIAPTGKGT